MPFIDHRKNSRTNWGRDVAGDTNPDREDIRMGALLRIADATEVMAQRHAELIRERDYLAQRNRDHLATIERLVRQRTALRGVVTRLKRAREPDQPQGDNHDQ